MARKAKIERNLDITARILDDIIKDNNDNVDDAYDVFAAATDYTNSAINDFLKTVIKRFDEYKYNIEEQHLPIIATINLLVKGLFHYYLKGTLQFSAKNYFDSNDCTYKEIIVDASGLKLITGALVTGRYKSDSFRTMIFPPRNEDSALNCISEITSFIEDFQEKLQSREALIETSDTTKGNFDAHTL